MSPRTRLALGVLAAAAIAAAWACAGREDGQDWIGYGAPAADDDGGDDDTGGDDDGGDDDTTPGDDDTGDDDTGDDDGGDDDTADVDGDGDGYTPAEGDCNDADPHVNPDSPELCDGVDNDCDGQTDEADAVGCVDYHLDADGDSYGDPFSQTVCLCDPDPPYSVTNQQDCYDGNPDAFPGQASYFTVDRGDGSFDFDCDTLEAAQWTGTFLCGLGCTSSQGWHFSEPPCGVGAEYGTGCHWDWGVFDCVDDTEQRIQACH